MRNPGPPPVESASEAGSLRREVRRSRDVRRRVNSELDRFDEQLESFRRESWIDFRDS